jgi:hypothetical protein
MGRGKVVEGWSLKWEFFQDYEELAGDCFSGFE